MARGAPATRRGNRRGESPRYGGGAGIAPDECRHLFLSRRDARTRGARDGAAATATQTGNRQSREAARRAERKGEMSEHHPAGASGVRHFMRRRLVRSAAILCLAASPVAYGAGVGGTGLQVVGPIGALDTLTVTSVSFTTDGAGVLVNGRAASITALGLGMS